MPSASLDELGPVGSLRERKKLATRLSLRRAAIELVVKRGYAGVTVEDIAEAADVSPRTFFNYFPSKDAALLGYDPDRNARICAALLSRPETETPLEALSSVILNEIGRITSELHEAAPNRALRSQIMHALRADHQLSAAYSANQSALEVDLTQALASRLGTDPKVDPYPTILAAAAISTARTALLHSGLDGSIEESAAAVRRAFALLATGFAVPTAKPATTLDRPHLTEGLVPRG